MAPRQRDDLAVRWVIGRVDADDLRCQKMVVLAHVLGEFDLRRRGPDDEDGIDAIDGSCDLGEESMRIIRVLLRLPTPFRMPVKVVLWGDDRCFVGRLRMDVEDARLRVIDPDRCMTGHCCLRSEPPP